MGHDEECEFILWIYHRFPIGGALKLDLDVLNYFKERAAAANAAPYQTQINSELRRIMERNDNGVPYSSLLDDDRFIAAIAERVQEHRKPR